MNAQTVGVDAVDVRRFADVVRAGGQPFLDRHFTPDEQAVCGGAVQRLAARFAAKEAVGKALGVGIPGTWSRQVEIVTSSSGAPSLRLHGEVATAAREHGMLTWSVSLTHTDGLAIAVVMAVGGDTS